MNRPRWIGVVAIFVLGPLMALDSGVSAAPPYVVGLVALATVIPAAAGLLSGNLRVLAVAAIISTLLLIVARVVSGVPLRWYAMPWIFYMLMYANWAYERRILA